MKRDRLGYAAHGEVAENVATLRPGLFYAPALKCDLRKFPDIKKLSATQMIVSFLDARVDAAHVDLRCNGGIPGMLAVDVDLAAELGEFSMSRAEELMHTETDG